MKGGPSLGGRLSGGHVPAAHGPGGPVLGIDAGGSSTRWLVLDEDGVRARGELGGLSGLSYLGAGSDRIAELKASVLAHTGAPAAVVAGVTGLSTGDKAAQRVADELAAALGTERGKVVVCNDMALVYRSAFEPGAGVAVYSGTGSIAIHETGDGALLRAGGHGYLIDDAGGGFWIGRQALRRVLRRADEAGAPAKGLLAEVVYAALGSSDWSRIREHVYSGGREVVASLVPAVGSALRAGDPDAREIVVSAGVQLARLANVLLARLDLSLPVALAGGVTALGEPLRRAVTDQLPPDCELVAVDREPVEVAALLALEEASR